MKYTTYISKNFNSENKRCSLSSTLWSLVWKFLAHESTDPHTLKHSLPIMRLALAVPCLATLLPWFLPIARTQLSSLLFAIFPFLLDWSDSCQNLRFIFTIAACTFFFITLTYSSFISGCVICPLSLSDSVTRHFYKSAFHHHQYYSSSLNQLLPFQ